MNLALFDSSSASSQIKIKEPDLEYIRSPKSYVVGVRSRRSIPCLISWLAENDLEELLLVHAVIAPWFKNPPYSGVRGIQLLEEHRMELRKMETMLAECKELVLLHYPHLVVRTRVETGEAADLLIDILAKERADGLLLFARHRADSWLNKLLAFNSEATLAKLKRSGITSSGKQLKLLYWS